MKRRDVIVGAGLMYAGALQPLRAQTVPTINIATVPVDAGAQVYYAADLGYFEPAGFTGTVSSITNGNAILNAVITGSIDVGYSNILSLEVAFKKGAPVTIVAPAAINTDTHPTNFMYVNAKSPIRVAKDLEGKTIAASPLGSMSQWAAVAWVDKYGGDSSRLKFVELPFPDMIPALLAGRVDAIYVVEPFGAAARPVARMLAEPYAAISKRLLGGAWFSSTQWVNAHPDLAARFAKAMRQTAVWANANQAKSAAILQKYTHVDSNLIAQMNRARYAETLDPADLQVTIDRVAVKYHVIDASFKAEDMIFNGDASRK
jgi:NitT/TauT family transport system substrate-binding protein